MLRPVVIMPVIVVCEKAPPIPTPDSVVMSGPDDRCPFCFMPFAHHAYVLPKYADGREQPW